MTLTVAVPLSRPERLPRLIETLQQQTFRDWRLVLVENGAGVGAHEVVSLPDDAVVLQSETGIAAFPRNAALAWLESQGGFVTFLDDDDYYGPGYLAETWDAMQRNPRALVGKCLRWVRFDDGLHYCLDDNQIGLTGAACGGHSSQMRPFPLQRTSEDHDWCVEAIGRGVELINLGPRHFVYDRRTSPGRALGLTKLQFLHSFGPARYYGDAPDEMSHEPLPTGGELIPKPTEEDLMDEIEAICARTPFPILPTRKPACVTSTHP